VKIKEFRRRDESGSDAGNEEDLVDPDESTVDETKGKTSNSENLKTGLRDPPHSRRSTREEVGELRTIATHEVSRTAVEGELRRFGEVTSEPCFNSNVRIEEVGEGGRGRSQGGRRRRGSEVC